MNIFKLYKDRHESGGLYEQYPKLGKVAVKASLALWSIKWDTLRVLGKVGHKFRCFFDCRRIEEIVFESSKYGEEYERVRISIHQIEFTKLVYVIKGTLVRVRGAGRYYGSKEDSDSNRHETIVDLRNPSIGEMKIYYESDDWERF